MKPKSISVCNKAILCGETHPDWLGQLPGGWAYALPGPSMAAPLPSCEIHRLRPNEFISIDWFPYMNWNSVKSLKVLHVAFIFLFSINTTNHLFVKMFHLYNYCPYNNKDKNNTYSEVGCTQLTTITFWKKKNPSTQTLQNINTIQHIETIHI
jgi:hypothetical protein